MATERFPTPVLIIEDNISYAAFLKETLIEELGVEPDEIKLAKNENEGRSYLVDEQFGFTPRALFLTIGLPDGDGLVFWQTMRENNERMKQMLTWVLTGDNNPSQEQYCREVLGVVDYLIKPTELPILLESLAKHSDFDNKKTND